MPGDKNKTGELVILTWKNYTSIHWKMTLDLTKSWKLKRKKNT